MFTSTKSKLGRPKKQLASCSMSHIQITGLFMLFARRQICLDGFNAGCYYESLMLKVNYNLGQVSGPSISVAARTFTDVRYDFCKGLQGLKVNRFDLEHLQEIEYLISMMHTNALTLLRQVIQMQDQKSCQQLDVLGYNQTLLLNKVLGNLYIHITRMNATAQQNMTHLAVA